MIDPYALDWLALALRWFHFMMGVAWIGASFYFVWLNNSIRPPSPAQEGVAGGLWAVHGGAFYEVRKLQGAPARLPEVLHWFKWEAYLTWLSGFALLVLSWWWQAGTRMVDPAVAALSPAQAVGVGAGTLVLGWLVYDGLCRSPLRRHGAALGLLLLLFSAGVAWGLSQVLSARAAWMHTGAMLGTWMAANVLFVIIPGQRAMVDALVAGAPPPVERGAAGALRSLHNNYLTLPVLFVMISSHFPSTWGHEHGWAVLVGLGLVGALYRHWVNVGERGRPQPLVLVASGLLLVALGFVTRPAPAPVAAPGQAAVPLTRVQQLVAVHCLGCHSATPLQPGFPVAPKGVVFDRPEDIERQAAAIHQQVVQTRVMPLGNLTGMTDEEREIVAAWVQGRGATP